MFGFLGKGPWFGTTRLCGACANGDLQSVKELASPELVNVKGWLGWAPLHKAAQSGASEVVEYLLANKDIECDVDIRDLENHTPLHLACGTPKEDLKPGHIESVRSLLKHGANPNAEDECGYTALQLATLNNSFEMAQLLLEHNAKVNHVNHDNFTALHTACRSQFQDIASLLVQHGADFNAADSKGRTPLQLAQRYGIKLNIPTELEKALNSELKSDTPASSTPTQFALAENNDNNVALMKDEPKPTDSNVSESSEKTEEKPIENKVDIVEEDDSALKQTNQDASEIQKEIEKELQELDH